MSEPINVRDVSQIYNTFYNLVEELEPFVEIGDLKIAFDSQGNVYLLGSQVARLPSLQVTSGGVIALMLVIGGTLPRLMTLTRAG